MDDPIRTERELATHANEIKHLQTDMDKVLEEVESIKAVVDEISTKLDRAEGGWHMLIWLGGIASGVAGFIGYVVGYFRG